MKSSEVELPLEVDLLALADEDLSPLEEYDVDLPDFPPSMVVELTAVASVVITGTLVAPVVVGLLVASHSQTVPINKVNT